MKQDSCGCLQGKVATDGERSENKLPYGWWNIKEGLGLGVEQDLLRTFCICVSV